MPVYPPYPKLFRNLTAALCVLIAVVTGWIAGARVQVPPHRWPDQATYAPADPLSDAAFMLTLRQRALIWEPADPAVPFAYQSLDDREHETGLLLYGTINPQTWASVPAQADAFHLVWIDTDNHLRSALVHTSGDTLRGPVNVLERAPGDITLVPASNGTARIFWRAADGTIMSLPLDSEGRPGRTTTHTPSHVQRFAVAADDDLNLHAIWLTAEKPGIWQIMTQRFDSTAAEDNPRLLYSFALPDHASIATLDLGLDRRYGYAILGTTHATQPDAEQITVIAFPLVAPGETRIIDLGLPAALHIQESPHPTPFITGPVAVLDESTPTQAALRWPRPISGQHAEFALALAVRREHTWQPGVVYFANGAPYGYQIVAPSPANASPPVLAAGQDGTLYLTWAGLERATARRYSASTGAQGWIVPGPDQAHLLRRTITGLLPGILISLAGLIPFVLAVIFIPARTWTPAAICALYAAGKLIWPPDLFTHMPPLLAYDPAAHIAAGWRVGLTVSAILLVAMVSAAAVRIPERTGWRRWVVFAALDITLTWIIFGPAFVG